MPKIQVHARQILHRVQQQRMQIGAVNGCVGRAIARNGRGPERQRRQLSARHRAAHLQLVGKGGHRLQLVVQPPGLQAPHHVRPDLHARPHFGKLGRTLEQPYLPTRALCGQCRCQATDAASGNQNLFLHGRDCDVTNRSGTIPMQKAF
ncbi:hypothetical protein SDC9_68039 [bioreactor metagenome]|uniref:Uncharacterized protein n=1 Tax=bioreactor metagenome TaxID=1076179 RepID=A0A644XZC0_9ZZZZ